MCTMWVNFVAELNYRGYAKPRNLFHPNPLAIQAIDRVRGGCEKQVAIIAHRC